MVYLGIALLASMIGAISGLGGGVLIKPILDMLSDFSASTISVLSTFTVFFMAISSIVRHFLQKTRINIYLCLHLSIGAILGGNIGNKWFNFVLHRWESDRLVTLIQNALLVVLLIGVLIYMNQKKRKCTVTVKHPIMMIGIGLGLGTMSAFLGIGGGPINILFLSLFFSMNAKEAAVNSLLLIFFSQASKITTIFISTGFVGMNLQLLWLMIPAGITGGLIGTKLYQKLPANKILTVFNCTNIFIVLVSVYNCIRIIGKV